MLEENSLNRYSGDMETDLEKRRARWRAYYYRSRNNPEWVEKHRERLKKAAAKNYAKRRESPEAMAKHNAWQRNVRESDPRRYAIYRIRNRYKVSDAEAEQLLQQKALGCQACGSKKRPHIDHDHVTGKVRGILCHNCNVTLGQVKDKISQLKSLILYLEKHQ